LKVLDKSLSLNCQYVEILHLNTFMKQALVCISVILAELAFTLLAYLAICHLLLALQYLVSSVQYTPL